MRALADVVDMVNRTPGRAGASLDGEMLDCVQEALADPSTDRKLIVVHLMGAHPHYSLRFPANANPFDDDVDAVENGLRRKTAARPGCAASARNTTPRCCITTSWCPSCCSRRASAGKPGDYRAWMYLSDHGQEVGHVSDRAGHSPATASGYRIPAVVWRNQQPLPSAAARSSNRFAQTGRAGR